jgi:hypothetical protein
MTAAQVRSMQQHHPDQEDMMNNPRALGESDLNRREFLRLALLTSAALANGAALLGAEETYPGAHFFGPLQPLAPGAVRPEGWLRNYLEKQAAQLGSKLPQISWPFTGTYWAGEESAENWWPWEQKAYWLDGATRLALVLEDKELMAQVRASLDYTLTHAGEKGYLGPSFLEDTKGGGQRWPHNVFFRGLAALCDATCVPGNPESIDIPAALREHFLSDDAAYGNWARNITNVEGMLWTYARTGDPALLALAENAWLGYMKCAPNPDGGDLSDLRVFAATPINAHGVTYAETMKVPAILYLYTGKEEYLRFASAAEQRIFDHHMLIDGIPSTTEFYRTVTSLDSHETCDIADHTWSWGYMLMATGDSVWADRVERACFNAAPGAIKNDWKALQYFSCPNQFLATLDSDHNVMARGGRMMAYQPNPGQKTACCGGNVHRILPNYAIRMWMKTTDGGLAAVLYGPSTVSARVGDGSRVRIVQTTEYPFRERIEMRIEADRAVAFPLALRVPGWCAAPHVEVNGAAAAVARNDKGFLVLRTFKPGDRIVLTLPMKLAVSRWPQNGMGIERGPIVYSLPIKANWNSRVEPKYTTEEFPSWEATPASDWNYGLAFDPDKAESEIQVKENPGPVVDPWQNPPTTLSVPVKKIVGWELQVDPDEPKQKFTPPLPDLSINKPTGAVERVSLVPYGATELRVTVFPSVRR